MKSSGTRKRVAPPKAVKAQRPAVKTKPTAAKAKPAAGTKKTATAKTTADSPSALIDARIRELGDWRGKTLSALRAVITAADAGVVEEWKWGVPVWSCDGIICTGESYKAAVKLTFAKGASLNDPSRLFNSSLDGNVRRAIDVHEGETLDKAALTALVKAAIAQNRSKA